MLHVSQRRTTPTQDLTLHGTLVRQRHKHRPGNLPFPNGPRDPPVCCREGGAKSPRLSSFELAAHRRKPPYKNEMPVWEKSSTFVPCTLSHFAKSKFSKNVSNNMHWVFKMFLHVQTFMCFMPTSLLPKGEPKPTRNWAGQAPEREHSDRKEMPVLGLEKAEKPKCRTPCISKSSTAFASRDASQQSFVSTKKLDIWKASASHSASFFFAK